MRRRSTRPDSRASGAPSTASGNDEVVRVESRREGVSLPVAPDAMTSHAPLTDGERTFLAYLVDAAVDSWKLAP